MTTQGLPSAGKQPHGKSAQGTVATISTAPLNDSTWNAFLFAVVPSAQTRPNSLNSFCETIGSGLRQRFSVVQRSEVIAWAVDNYRTHDACKDIKTLMEADPTGKEISDSAVAKALRLRLQALRTESIESRNNGGSRPESGDVPANEALDAGKKAKVNDKDKDKDKGKASAKKAPAGKDAKGKPVEAPPSRPDSAAKSADISKRKSKLRDRGAKNDARTVAIGDEPVDGPDAYYLLKDFNSVSMLNCIIEEMEIPVHAIVTYHSPQHSASKDAPTPTLKAGPTDLWSNNKPQLINDLLVAKRNAQANSLWMDCTWLDINSSEYFDNKEVFNEFAKLIYNVLEVKKSLKNLYAADDLVNIPYVSDWLSVVSYLQKCGYPKRDIGVSAGLSDVLLSVITELATSSELQPAEKTAGGDNVAAWLSNYIQKSASKILLAHGMKAGAKSEAVGTASTVQETKVIHPSDVWESSKDLIEKLGAKSFEPYSLVPLTLSQDKLEEVEDIITRRQLMKDGVPSEIDRFITQLEFEEVLQANGKPWNLDEWNWIDMLDRSAMLQVLNREFVTASRFVTHKSKRTGKLLIAFVPTCAEVGEVTAIESTDLSCKTKLGFAVQYYLSAIGSPTLKQPSPIASGTNRPYIYTNGAKLVQFHQESKTIQFTNGSSLVIQQNSTPSSKSRQTTATLRWNDVSIQLEGSKNTCLMIMPDGTVMSFAAKALAAGSVNAQDIGVTLSRPNGLLVEFRPAGVMQTYRQSTLAKNKTQTETSRLFMYNGKLVKYMENQSVEVYHSNGTTCAGRVNPSNKAGGMEWKVTDIAGHHVLSATKVVGTVPTTTTTPLPSVRVAKETYITLNKTIYTREDGISLTESDMGSYAEFVDGTVISTALKEVPKETATAEKVTSSGAESGDANGVTEAPANKVIASFEILSPQAGGYLDFAKTEDGAYQLKIPSSATIKKFVKVEGDVQEDCISYTSNQLQIIVKYSGEVQLIKFENGESVKDFTLDWRKGIITAEDSQPWVSINLSEGIEVEQQHSVPVQMNLKKKAVTPLAWRRQLTEEFGLYSIFDHETSPVNCPRLFVVEGDGSGYEMCRESQVLDYLQKVKNDPQETTQVYNQIQNDLTCVQTITQPSADEDEVDMQSTTLSSTNKTKIVQQRQLVRFQSMSVELRNIAHSLMMASNSPNPSPV